MSLDTALMGIAGFGVMVMVNSMLCSGQSHVVGDISFFDSLLADARGNALSVFGFGCSVWSVSVLAGFCINTVMRARILQPTGPIGNVTYLGLCFACCLVVGREQVAASKRVAERLKMEKHTVLQEITISQYLGSTWIMYAGLSTVTLVRSLWSTMGLLFSHTTALGHSVAQRRLLVCWVLVGGALFAYCFFAEMNRILPFR